MAKSKTLRTDLIDTLFAQLKDDPEQTSKLRQVFRAHQLTVHESGALSDRLYHYELAQANAARNSQ